MAERLDWFPCNPSKLLGALAGMRAPEGYVYTIVLLRIYEDGGVCRDTLDALATRTRLNRRVVSEALDSLFRAGRLLRNGDGISNPVAAAVIAESYALREKRKSASSKAGTVSAEKRKSNQQNGATNRAADVERTSTPLQVQDTLFPNGNRALNEESVAMKNPPPDQEADYFIRGRVVLGQSAGGMLKKLLVAKGGNVSLARAALEQASTRGDARQYIGAMIRNGGQNETTRGDRNGLAIVGANLRRAVAEKRSRQDAGAPPAYAGDASAFQFDDRSGNPGPGLGTVDQG